MAIFHPLPSSTRPGVYPTSAAQQIRRRGLHWTVAGTACGCSARDGHGWKRWTNGVTCCSYGHAYNSYNWLFLWDEKHSISMGFS